MSKKSAHDGKVKYSSEFLAMGALRGLAKEGSIKIGAMLPYKCPYCDGWHIGHPDPETQRLIHNAITRSPAKPKIVVMEKPPVVEDRWVKEKKSNAQKKKRFVPPLIRMHPK